MRQIAQLGAVALWAIAYLAKKMFGLELQPSALIGMGGVLIALAMRLPPLDGVWQKRAANALLVVSAVLAVAFQSAPEWAADVMRFAPQVPTMAEAPAEIVPETVIEAGDVLEVTTPLTDSTEGAPILLAPEVVEPLDAGLSE